MAFVPSRLLQLPSLHHMSHTYFIADIHLSEDRPDITDCFLDFLQHQARQAEALYVLGDLFEYWVGDDDVTAFNQKIARAFKQLSHTVPVYYIHGNRDFAIRQQYADRAGFSLLPEQQVINLYGKPTLIMHGDELCTLDLSYQKFRKKARSWWWPRLMLMLPLWYRRKVKDEIRAKSKTSKGGLTLDIMDVSQAEVIKQMQQNGVRQLIHGHTHRPAIHQFELAGKAASRIVLGDWYNQGSLLKVSADDTELKNIPFKTNKNGV